MSELKCPICGTILDKAFINDKIRGCPKCRNMGNIELWQELIRTRKALEIIKKEMSNEYMPDYAVIRDALKTALEQKDK